LFDSILKPSTSVLGKTFGESEVSNEGAGLGRLGLQREVDQLRGLL
jgi:hypothetical protein